MAGLTGFVLRHKRLVAAAWLLITVAGFAMIGKATGALSPSFSIPGQGFKTDSTIERLYHNGGDHLTVSWQRPRALAAQAGTAG
jgi:hypothetical protein